MSQGRRNVPLRTSPKSCSYLRRAPVSAAATARLHGIYPRRCSSPRNIHVAAARLHGISMSRPRRSREPGPYAPVTLPRASDCRRSGSEPRPSSEYPRCGRGGAATSLRHTPRSKSTSPPLPRRARPSCPRASADLPAGCAARRPSRTAPSSSRRRGTGRWRPWPGTCGGIVFSKDVRLSEGRFVSAAAASPRSAFQRFVCGRGVAATRPRRSALPPRARTPAAPCPAKNVARARW